MLAPRAAAALTSMRAYSADFTPSMRLKTKHSDVNGLPRDRNTTLSLAAKYIALQTSCNLTSKKTAPPSSSRTYKLPNGRIMTCTSSGSNTNFFKPRGRQLETNLIESCQFFNRHISVSSLLCNKLTVTYLGNKLNVQFQYDSFHAFDEFMPRYVPNTITLIIFSDHCSQSQ